MATTRRSGLEAMAMLLAALTLGASGCATAAIKGGSATFTIPAGADGCPQAPKMEVSKRNCPTWVFWTKDDCVKAERGTTIEFVAAEGVKPFAVYFQPFNPLSAEGRRASFRIDPNTPGKEYPFSIVAKGCPVIDPSIIVEQW